MSILNHKNPKYDIKLYYSIYFETGLIVSLLTMIALFNMDLEIKEQSIDLKERSEIISIEEIVQTEQINKPPPPPRPPVPIEVPNDVIVEEIDLNMDASLDVKDALEIPKAPPKNSSKVEEEVPEIFIAVEQMPELIGGLEAVQRNIIYPEIAKKAGIEGKVYVQFIIDEKGNVTNPVVLKGIGGGCDEAALEAVKKAKFRPGKQRGRPVKVQYSIPIIFRLTAADKK
jgi:protein TonB